MRHKYGSHIFCNFAENVFFFIMVSSFKVQNHFQDADVRTISKDTDKSKDAEVRTQTKKLTGNDWKTSNKSSLEPCIPRQFTPGRESPAHIFGHKYGSQILLSILLRILLFPY